MGDRTKVSRSVVVLVAAALSCLVTVVFWDAFVGGLVFFERDVHGFWYPMTEAFVRCVAEGAWPVWHPWEGFGVPMLANPAHQVAYPLSWLNLVLLPATYYKLFVFVLSAMMAGVAGALYVPQVGIINPGEFAPANSIEIVIWVAVGGRGTLVGAALGAVLANYAKTYFTGALPDIWLFALGGLFIAVTLFLPKGIVGTLQIWRPFARSRTSFST